MDLHRIVSNAVLSNVLAKINPTDNLNKQVTSVVTPRYDVIVSLGNFNTDQLYVNAVAKCMMSYDFLQLIDDPTRITSSSQKLLNPIFINKPDLTLNSGTLNTDFMSDHQAVFCSIKIDVPKLCPQIKTYRNF
ncbi:hypothetical protein TcasGA2_TC016071 [Tribolium castaneum]|uniref:Endonuclease/exonuclease/phosphatase domain-containing protein n=1 Tax=Tribolium castaneum TaxID=7070 RepID=D6X3M4_TRICA|nr:hypothetical protein TcasGA2_TC016071 [Tribolium castaneum]